LRRGHLESVHANGDSRQDEEGSESDRVHDVDIDTKKTAAKPSKKAKMDDSDRLYKKEELEELKHMPRKNSSRDKPRSAAKKRRR